MLIQRWDYAGAAAAAAAGGGAALRIQVEDSLHFYLDSAADGVFGGGGGAAR